MVKNYWIGKLSVCTICTTIYCSNNLSIVTIESKNWVKQYVCAYTWVRYANGGKMITQLLMEEELIRAWANFFTQTCFSIIRS